MRKHIPPFDACLGATLRQWRHAQHKTLGQVAATSKCSLGYLSEVERGHKQPTARMMSNICYALGHRLSDLIHETATQLDHDYGL